MSKVNNQNDESSKKLTEVERSIKFVCEISDQIIQSNAKMESEISMLKSKNKSLNEHLQNLTLHNKELQQMCIDTQCRPVT